MTRNGKIARLPRHIRDELNHRLDNAEQAVQLVEWLNSLPEVKKILARDFGGRPINEQNLSDWKAGGHEDWRTEEQSRIHEQSVAAARAVHALGEDIDEWTDDRLAHHLATVVAARYAALLQNWNGEMTDQFRARVRALRSLNREITRLQRGNQGAERMKIERERLDLQKMKAKRHLMQQSFESMLTSSLFAGPSKPAPKPANMPQKIENSAAPNGGKHPNQGESR